MGGSSAASQSGRTPSYWDRFEIIDDVDSDESEDDVDMKDLEARAGEFKEGIDDYEGEGIINDEIEDIESDDENVAIGEYMRQE